MAKKITMVRIRIGAEKGGVRSVSVTRGRKTVTGSLEGSQAAQKKGLQRLIRAWCRTGVKVVMTVEGSKEVCTYCKEGTRYVCTKSTRSRLGGKRLGGKPAKPGRKPGKTEEVAYPLGLETQEKREYAKENERLLDAVGVEAAFLFRRFISQQLNSGLTLKKALTEWRAQSRRKPAKPGRKPAKPGRKPGRKVSAYNKFVAAQRKAGKTMKQAAAAWRAHKAETGKTEVMAKPRRKPVSDTAKTEVMAKPAKPAKPAKTDRKPSAYNKFVAAQRKAGKSMKEAAAAWRAQGGGAEKATKAKAKKSTKAKATAKPKTTKPKTTKPKTTKPKTAKASSAALPAVGDVVAAAALRSARRKHGTVKHRGNL